MSFNINVFCKQCTCYKFLMISPIENTDKTERIPTFFFFSHGKSNKQSFSFPYIFIYHAFYAMTGSELTKRFVEGNDIFLFFFFNIFFFIMSLRVKNRKKTTNHPIKNKTTCLSQSTAF